MKIGIGIITSGQRDLRPEYSRFAPSGARMMVFVDKDRRGGAYCRNQVLKMMDDQEIDHIFMFDDDVWPMRHDFFDRVIEAAKRNDLGFIGLPHFTGGYDLKGTSRDCVIVPGVTVQFMYMSRECFEKVGYFDERFGRYAPEDSDYVWRCAMHGFAGKDSFAFPVQISQMLYAQDLIDGFSNSTFSDSEKKEVFNQGVELLKRKVENKEIDHIPFGDRRAASD